MCVINVKVMSFNLKELFAGNRVKVEMPKPKPVGRPKKRPKDLEAVVKQELPDIDLEIQQLVKPKPTFEIDDAEFMDCLDECIEEDAQFQDVEQDVESAIVVKQELDVENSSVVLSSPTKTQGQVVLRTPEKAKIDVTGASQALVELGYSPMSPNVEMRIEHARYGALGAHHGIKGAEFGRLGGRPPAKQKVERGGLVASLAQVALSRGNRKRSVLSVSGMTHSALLQGFRSATWWRS